MKIEMLESGESPEFGAFKVGDIIPVNDETGTLMVTRGLAKELEMTLTDVAVLAIDNKVESKKKGGKDNG